MILQAETLIKYGHSPFDLKPKSAKRILAACDDCGKVRETSMHDYHSLCNSCAQKGKNKGNTYALGYKQTEEQKAIRSATMKGNTYCLGNSLTEEHKAKIRVALKGNTNGLGYKRTDEEKAKISAALKGKYVGEKSSIYKGGKKLAWARHSAKREQLLGYTLLLPLQDGEEGHHITDEYVMGIPRDIHKQFSGYSRKKHRTLILQWLKVNDKKKYLKVLCVLAKEPIYMIQKREII